MKTDDYISDLQKIGIPTSSFDNLLFVRLQGLVSEKAGKYDEAERFYKKANDLQQAYFQSDEITEASIISDLGLVCQKLNNKNDAVDRFNASLDIGKKELEKAFPDNSVIFQIFGGPCIGIDARNRTVEKCDAAIDAYKVGVGIERYLAEVNNIKGVSAADSGDIDEAVKCYSEALEIMKNAQLINDSRYPSVLYNYADALSQKGERAAEATELYREALNAYRKLHGNSSKYSVAVKAKLGDLYFERFSKYNDKSLYKTAEQHLIDAYREQNELNDIPGDLIANIIRSLQSIYNNDENTDKLKKGFKEWLDNKIWSI